MKFYFILEGIFSLFYILLTQGPIFTGLAMLFNLDELQLGIAAAIPSMMQVFQLFSYFFISKFRNRRKLVNILNIIGRTLFSSLLIAMVLKTYNPILFLIVLAMSQVFSAMAGSIWASWMRDLIPEDQRGRVFALRNIYLSIATVGVMYLYSFLVDTLKFGFEAVMALGLVGSIMSVWAMRKIPDVPIKVLEAGFPVMAILKDTGSRRYLVFSFYWSMSIMFSAAFYHYHLLKDLKISYTYIATLSILTNFLAIFAYRFWGKRADEIGHKTVAEFGILTVSTISFMWFFMNSHTYGYLLIADSVMTAFGWSAMNLALTIIPMEVAFGSGTVFFGLNALFSSVGGLLGSLIGGSIAKVLSPHIFEVAGFEIYGLQILFLLAGVFRYSSVFFLRRVPLRKYIPARRIILDTVRVILRRPVVRVFDRAFLAYVLSRLRKRV